MPSIRSRVDNGLLFFDFRFHGDRCREQTLLSDTPANRRKLEKVLDKIEAEIAAGTFVYANYFPNSKALARLERVAVQTDQIAVAPVGCDVHTADPIVIGDDTGSQTPTFSTFATQWFKEHEIEWRRSHIRSLRSTLDARLIPHFGQKVVSSITKSDILAYRATLAKVKGRGDKEGLSPKRINEIIGTLCQIMDEAADRFEFTTPTTNIKRLRVRKVDVDPFSLQDVQSILATVRADYRNYFTVRFFTGMRTGEVHGLKWRYVDFERRLIRVRETFVLGEDEYTKTDGSQRDIQMSQPVVEALTRQYEVTGKLSDYVFCNLMGAPLDNKNFTDRIWYPLLRHLGMAERRPYQMRHTAATLWLAAGEAPEWIARQLGHTSTEMLFKVYSRYVPNLTRQDGSAMERLLASRMATGQVIRMEEGGADAGLRPVHTDLYAPVLPAPQAVPKPRGVHKPAQAGASLRGNTSGAMTRRPTDIVLPAVHHKGEPQAPPGPWMRTGRTHSPRASA
ncbi:MAG: integrase [Verminephrobacter sp.]|nr:integrase [Verminephrobacter sp.]